MSTSDSGNKLPPIPCNGWCYTEADEDIVYDYAWTIERFSRAAVNFRTGESISSDIKEDRVRSGQVPSNNTKFLLLTLHKGSNCCKCRNE